MTRAPTGDPLDFDWLDAETRRLLLRHLEERGAALNSADNLFLADFGKAIVRLVKDDAAANALIDKLNAWSAAKNLISERSDAEIARIVGGGSVDPPPAPFH